MYNDIYMLWLSSMMGQIDSRKLNLILEVYGTARDAFLEKPADLQHTVSLTARAARIFREKHSLQYIEQLLTELENKKIAYFSR